nr:MAG TPA: hypothetical protein [Microviridae sp.]
MYAALQRTGTREALKTIQNNERRKPGQNPAILKWQFLGEQF